MGWRGCKLEMLQYWLVTTMTASIRDIARALEQLNMLTIVARLKSKYLWTSPATAADGVCVCCYAHQIEVVLDDLKNAGCQFKC